jgi:predicted nucleic acid-binding protein
MPAVLLDTGPLVALLVKNEKHHAWAKARFAELRPPLLTCEAVLAESLFLLAGIPGGAQAVFGLLARGVVAPAFSLAAQAGPVAQLMQRYASVPMSLADACLVRMAELTAESAVVTLDADFSIYRRNGRQVIPLVTPPRR